MGDDPDRKMEMLTIDATFPPLFKLGIWGLGPVGGVCYDMFIYAVAYAMHLMGEVVRVRPRRGPAGAAQPQRPAGARRGRFLADDTCDRLRRRPRDRAEALPRRRAGDARHLGGAADHQPSRLERDGGKPARPLGAFVAPGQLYRGYARYPYAEQWADFVAAIEQNDPGGITTSLRAARDVVGVTAAVVASAESGEAVTIGALPVTAA
jgi:predicted dehydrogenase